MLIHDTEGQTSQTKLPGTLWYVILYVVRGLCFTRALCMKQLSQPCRKSLLKQNLHTDPLEMVHFRSNYQILRWTTQGRVTVSSDRLRHLLIWVTSILTNSIKVRARADHATTPTAHLLRAVATSLAYALFDMLLILGIALLTTTVPETLRRLRL